MNIKYLTSDVVLRLERMLETKHTSLQSITGCPKKLIHSVYSSRSTKINLVRVFTPKEIFLVVCVCVCVWGGGGGGGGGVN